MTQKTKPSPKKRTVHTKKSPARITTSQNYESDGTYLLKLVLFVLCGTLWLKFKEPVEWLGLPFSGFPVGLILGLLLVHQFENHQSDRKIWYACLLVVTIICYFVPAGILI